MNSKERLAASTSLPCAAHGGGSGWGHESTAPIPTFPRKRGKGLLVTTALLSLLALSACGNIEPWVKPYERQNLADPVMSFDLNPVSSAYMDHVYEAREGARGALGGAGGGCGCN